MRTIHDIEVSTESPPATAGLAGDVLECSGITRNLHIKLRPWLNRLLTEVRVRLPTTQGTASGPRRWLLVMLLACASAPVAAIDITVRDSQTGASVEARLTANSLSDPSTTAARQTLTGGAMQNFPLASGRWQLELSAIGYRDLRTTIESGGSDELPLTILLDPIAPPASLIEAERLAAKNPAHAWLHGYVRRVDDATPLVNARISAASISTVSDSQGHFVLDLGKVYDDGDALADGFELLVEADGFAPYTLTGLHRSAGLQQRLVSLGNGAPAFRVNAIGARDQRLSTPLIAMNPSAPVISQPMAGTATLLALPLTPPVSIRVGYADAACTTPCCTGSCTNVCTLPLETYVRRGLDNEWIASWSTQSLRAGSIAYRSYGAPPAARTPPWRARRALCSHEMPTRRFQRNTRRKTTAGITRTMDCRAAMPICPAVTATWDRRLPVGRAWPTR